MTSMHNYQVQFADGTAYSVGNLKINCRSNTVEDSAFEAQDTQHWQENRNFLTTGLEAEISFTVSDVALGFRLFAAAAEAGDAPGETLKFSPAPGCAGSILVFPCCRMLLQLEYLPEKSTLHRVRLFFAACRRGDAPLVRCL